MLQRALKDLASTKYNLDDRGEIDGEGGGDVNCVKSIKLKFYDLVPDHKSAKIIGYNFNDGDGEDPKLDQTDGNIDPIHRDDENLDFNFLVPFFKLPLVPVIVKFKLLLL